MDRLHLTNQVEKILRASEKARNSDEELYLMLLYSLDPEYTKMPISDFFAYRKAFDIPSIESVGRIRRKVQERNPELKPNKVLQGLRIEQETEWKVYAKCK